MKSLVLYHSNCSDGMAAAWIAWHYFRGKHGTAEFVPVNYGKPPPVVTGCEVFILDFSYPHDVMIQMCKDAKHVAVLDHHKTARDDFAKFSTDMPSNLEFMFDMERSGAVLAWNYFHPPDESGEEHVLPWPVEFVQDRDLWRHKLRFTREVNASIKSWAFDFADWDAQVAKGLQQHIKEGAGILRFIDQQVNILTARHRLVGFEGYEIPCINVGVAFTSEALSVLAEQNMKEDGGAGFAIGWSQNHDGSYLYSLRAADKSEVDVSELAKHYGGGGHQKAAGFQTDKFLF